MQFPGYCKMMHLAHEYGVLHLMPNLEILSLTSSFDITCQMKNFEISHQTQFCVEIVHQAKLLSKE